MGSTSASSGLTIRAARGERGLSGDDVTASLIGRWAHSLNGRGSLRLNRQPLMPEVDG
jgi:hypothetical protein